MATREPERAVQLSVLDRLIDYEPRAQSEAPMSRSRSVDYLKASLLRDLEWMLNTRRVAIPAPDLLEEVRESVYHFGLPDVTSLSGDSSEVRWRLMRQVEELLELFEPRLSGTRVVLAETTEEGRRDLRFVIEGMLQMEPTPERVVFDTILEVGSGRIRVQDHD